MIPRNSLPFLLLLLVPSLALAQAPAAATELPSGTPLVVQINGDLPMKIGQPIVGHLLYPVYVDNHLALPEHTAVNGIVTALRPDRSRRIAARLRGDFTPFHIPVVQFNALTLPDGSTARLTTTAATDGAPIFRLVAPPPRKGGFIRQQLDTGIGMAKDRIAVITGPDKRDRLTQLLYSQLPLHPQRIEKHTAWTLESTSPVTLSTSVPGAPGPPPATAASRPGEPPTWIVQAFLKEDLSSSSNKVGQTIHATVAEPIRNPDGTLAVPQGSVLEGAVTQARPARRFGRAGVLRFDFRQITLPGAPPQNVQTSLTGVDSVGGRQLAMDSEGKVKPKPQDKLLVPLILLSLAARPLDRDRGDAGAREFGKNAVASNALGALGFIVGTAARQRNLAAGIGYYGAAVSLYNRWIKRGDEITFGHDTRIVVQTTARRSAILPPSSR